MNSNKAQTSLSQVGIKGGNSFSTSYQNNFVNWGGQPRPKDPPKKYYALNVKLDSHTTYQANFKKSSGDERAEEKAMELRKKQEFVEKQRGGTIKIVGGSKLEGKTTSKSFYQEGAKYSKGPVESLLSKPFNELFMPRDVPLTGSTSYKQHFSPPKRRVKAKLARKLY